MPVVIFERRDKLKTIGAIFLLFSLRFSDNTPRRCGKNSII